MLFGVRKGKNQVLCLETLLDFWPLVQSGSLLPHTGSLSAAAGFLCRAPGAGCSQDKSTLGWVGPRHSPAPALSSWGRRQTLNLI